MKVQFITDLKSVTSRPWLDYSSLSNFMTCPRKYWWRCVRHVDSVNIHPALTNGKAYHECIAAYHASRIKGETFEEAVKKGLVALVARMQEITVEDPDRNTTVAVDTMKNYFLRWKDDVSKVLYVETGGAVDLGEFIYVGLIDAIIENVYGIGVRETKSTTVVGERWQLRGKPNMQIEGYMFMASVLTGLEVFNAALDIIPVHRDSKKRKDPFRILTMRTEEELACWHKNIIHWWKQIDMCRKDNFFPTNTDNCAPIRSGDCPFLILCKLYPDPHGKEELNIPAEYTIRPWLPLESLIEGKDKGGDTTNVSADNRLGGEAQRVG